MAPAPANNTRRVQAPSDASREAHRQALLKGAGDARNVPEAALAAALNMQMVEPIPLLHNTPQNGYVAINMYSDDQASFKRAARNPRACDILMACGGNPMDVLGDVFIGRLFDNEDDFRRLDFTLDELRSDAPWIKEAALQAAQRRDRSGQVHNFAERIRGGSSGGGGGSVGARPVGAGALPPPPKEVPPAEAAKARGNAAVNRGDWQAAADEYAAALALDPALIAARNNRALALLKLGQMEAAEADCTAVLEAEPGNIKALLRRAAARRALGRLPEAGGDLQAVLELQPHNKEAAGQLAALQAPRIEGDVEDDGAAASRGRAAAAEAGGGRVAEG
ncbi:hypothetical protein MNEG_5942 [Monoraphidium neglectum]|uniref:Uncharacterized protein n=1 Tax=Monoraphidium neglectum TaxID=145388 RepID=A0A0D2JSP6_9CHLO|nr:hypothetical protein MNEG_5942 [Monoraphidium neglectum]KIZ02018.1 hypothetical protein MNEG_5942 [Monoraphidium neglectum]|eukprot:XP_013901037.1 hypothetical protein MNEG_5942 [Monoraphidium neglectum]